MLKYELKKTCIINYLLFLTGLNSGMRVSDVVNLNRCNIRDENNLINNSAKNVGLEEIGTHTTRKNF